VGRALAAQGVGLVYGGGHGGLMGVVADAVLGAGGHVTGVIPERLVKHELAHAGVQELLVVPGMHERKKAMAERSQGFIALPGGLGTLEELFEIWTWQQLGYHQRPIGLLDVGGFYAPLMAFLRQVSAQGFVSGPTLDRIIVDADPQRLVERVAAAARLSPDGPTDWVGS